jgi:hypothetical protein
VTFHPKKVFKTESSGVNEQSVYLKIKCHSGSSEPYDVVMSIRFMDVETLLGRLNVDILSRHQLP